MDLCLRHSPLRILQRHYPLLRWLDGLAKHASRHRELAEVSHIVSFLESWADPIAISLFLTNKVFRDIVVSVAATYGLYLLGSLIHFEPWHMFTSFLQYMFLLPSCGCRLRLIRIQPLKFHSS